MDDDAIKVAIAAANRFVFLQRTISNAFVTLLGFCFLVCGKAIFSQDLYFFIANAFHSTR